VAAGLGETKTTEDIMLSQQTIPAAHAGEEQSSGAFAARLAHHNNTMAGISAARRENRPDTAISRAWSFKLPAIDNVTLTAAILQQPRTVRAGDVVYVTEVRHHVVNDDDLDAAARAVIGSAS
jgi:hypothetical protein